VQRPWGSLPNIQGDEARRVVRGPDQGRGPIKVDVNKLVEKTKKTNELKGSRSRGEAFWGRGGAGNMGNQRGGGVMSRKEGKETQEKEFGGSAGFGGLTSGIQPLLKGRKKEGGEKRKTETKEKNDGKKGTFLNKTNQQKGGHNQEKGKKGGGSGDRGSPKATSGVRDRKG